MRTAILMLFFLLATISAVCATDGPRTGVGWMSGNNTDPSGLRIGAMVYLFDYANTGYDSAELRYPYETWDDSTNQIQSWFRRDNGVDGWDGPSGWYHDQDLPIPSVLSSIIVKNLYVWAGQSFAYDTFKIGYLDAGYPNPEEWVRKLRLVKVPDGINYTGPKEWIIPLQVNKVGGTFLPDAVLPAYKTDNPLTGYQFEIEIQHVVPEPSSVLALIGGLAGIGGFAFKRHRS